jgi:hypothetical protein
VKHSAQWRESLLGKALDPFSGETRQHVALVAFLAWVGLGADGLSSACYGPEEAFLALGAHTPLSLYLAAMTAVTVFVIAVAYNLVIELFPSGGGYKVASNLLGSHAGLASGSALIVDYVLLSLADHHSSRVAGGRLRLQPKPLAAVHQGRAAIVGDRAHVNSMMSFGGG